MPWRPQWMLYVMEAGLLATFMLAACGVCVVMLHPASPMARRLRHPVLRRACIGAAMGTTAVMLITSPWGRATGGHMNPAVTLAFTFLGKLDPRHAVGYIVGQCVGGVAGVAMARLLLGSRLAHPAVKFAATEPGPRGARVALVAEVIISFGLFATVLVVSNSGATMAYTPLAAGVLVTLFITFEAPLSGMSMNPARTLGSAVVAGRFTAWPVYVLGPILGMGAAASLHASVLGTQSVHCGKLDHRGEAPCPFNCTIDALRHRAEAGGIQGARPGR